MTIKGNPSRIYYSLQEVNFMRVFNKYLPSSMCLSSLYYQPVYLCFLLAPRSMYLCGNSTCLCELT